MEIHGNFAIVMENKFKVDIFTSFLFVLCKVHKCYAFSFEYLLYSFLGEHYSYLWLISLSLTHFLAILSVVNMYK